MFPLKALMAPCAPLLLIACASAPAPYLPPDHPAHPHAPVAQYRDAPNALARDRDATQAASPDDLHAGHHHPDEAPAEEDPHAQHR